MRASEEVKQKTDIVAVIGQSMTLTKAGRTFKGLCPFHGEKHPSFFVYPEQQSWHCFGCNSGGDVFSFVMKQQDIDFPEALRQLAEPAGVTITPRPEADAEGKRQERLYQTNQAAALYFHNILVNSPAGAAAHSYLAGRHILPQTIADFQLGFSLNSWEGLKQHLLARDYTESELLEAGLLVATESGTNHDRFRNRLIFPIFDIKGRVTGFGARVLDDSLPKYLNSPQTPVFDKSGTVYGINRARTAIRQQDQAVIVEGYMDVITAHQQGFDNVVATMGTAVTLRQVTTLKRLTRNLVLALDADAAGEEAMRRCVGHENTLDTEIMVTILPPGQDPDSVIRQDAASWRNLLGAAIPVIDYIIKTVTAEVNVNSAAGKSAATERLLPVIAKIKDPVRRAHYLQQLAQLLKVSDRDIEAALAGYKSAPTRTRSVASSEIKPTAVSSPVEEYCLALLLQHPELKAANEQPAPEYFESSENREIFIAWQQLDSPESVRESLDPNIYQYLDTLTSRQLPANQIESRLFDITMRLKERYLRNLETKIKEVLASAAAGGGSAAELAILEEHGTTVSNQLRQIFYNKNQRGQQLRR